MDIVLLFNKFIYKTFSFGIVEWRYYINKLFILLIILQRLFSLFKMLFIYFVVLS